jgi:Tol biopolymer transport system component
MVFFKTKLQKSRELINAGKYDEAIRILSAAVSKKSDDEQLYFYLAKAYFEKNDIAKTKENLLNCLKFDLSDNLIEEIVEITNFKKIASDHNHNIFFNFSWDGSKIVFVSIRRDTNGDGRINQLDNGGIYVIGTNGKNERQIADDRYLNTDCSFSPDGGYVVYLSRRRDTNGDGKIDYKDSAVVYLFDLEKGEEQVLVSDESYNKKPVFTPDGQSVVFCSLRRLGRNYGVFSINIKTKELTELVSDLYENTAPSLSKDNRYVLYSSWREDKDGDGKIDFDFRDKSAIYITDIQDKVTVQLTKDRYDNSFPSFSPDDKEIVYLSRRRDTNGDGKIDSLDFWGIYTISLDKKIPEEIVADKYYNKFPSFTKDGESVIFLGSIRRESRCKNEEIRDTFENKSVFILNVRKKDVTQLTSTKYFSASFPQVSSTNKVAYLSWRKHTRRGIFIRDIYRLPTIPELKEIIEENL